MGTGKKRWKISFHRSSATAAFKTGDKTPPKEFICPISGSLMADPVIVSSGQTFEKNCVQVCKNLSFLPILSDESKPDFSTVIPNIAIKSTILKWCDTYGVEWPKPLELGVAEKLVRALMAESPEEENPQIETPEIVEENPPIETHEKVEGKIGGSDRELLKAVAENPSPVKFSHASTDLNRHRPGHFYTSSEEWVTTGIPSTPLLLLTTRSSCCSSSSSSEIETLNPNSSEEEEIIISKLKSSQVFEQEEGVISLRKITKTQIETRVPLCSSRLLSSLRSLLFSRYSAIQINAVAALVNLSLEKINKVKIVRSGIVPLLIDVLKGGFNEAQEHAAGALFSLSLDDENKTAIGVLGALPPLLHMLRSESERARNDSGLVLYHLSLVQSNRSKLVKLGSIPMLLTMAKAGDLASRALLILCNLAACSEGRAAMLDGNAVELLVGMVRGSELESEVSRENCVAVLHSLSQGSLRFRGLAMVVGAVEVMREVAERGGSERMREKAKVLLQVMKGRDERRSELLEEMDWENFLKSGGMSQSRYCGKNGSSSNSNSTEF